MRFTLRTVKLLSRSGLILIILSMGGSVAMAAARVSGPVEATAWEGMLGSLVQVVAGIAVYYIALAIFAWLFVIRKGKS